MTGAGGRMGQEVCRAVTGATDLELVAAVDPAAAGQQVAETTIEIVGALEEVDPAGADVLVDFTVATSAERHLDWCADHGVHAVVGPTGFSE